MQIVPKLGMLTIVEIEAELMNNFTFVEMTVSYSMIRKKDNYNEERRCGILISSTGVTDSIGI